MDDGDFEALNQWKWHAYKDWVGSWRVKRSDSIFLHRVIMGLKKNDGLEVDHINHDTLDNRRSNLRICLRVDNGRNRRLNKNSSTGMKGVRFHKRSRLRPWQAGIEVLGKFMYLGAFKSRDDAALAYDSAARKLFGEYAVTNFQLYERTWGRWF